MMQYCTSDLPVSIDSSRLFLFLPPSSLQMNLTFSWKIKRVWINILDPIKDIDQLVYRSLIDQFISMSPVTSSGSDVTVCASSMLDLFSQLSQSIKNNHLKTLNRITSFLKISPV